MDNTELLNLIIVSLISADTCVDVESCEKSLQGLEVLRERVDAGNFGLNPEEKKKYIERIDNGISIVKHDLEDFKK